MLGFMTCGSYVKHSDQFVGRIIHAASGCKEAPRLTNPLISVAHFKFLQN
jgi:hypothetical protein